MRKVYVPAPILKALRDAGFQGRDYFDVNRLLNILSPEDVAFYYFTNLRSSLLLPEEIDLSFGNALLYGGLTEFELKKAAAAQVVIPWDVIEDERIRKEVARQINDYCVSDSAPQLEQSVDVELSSEILWVEGGQLLLFTHVPVSAKSATASAAERCKAMYQRLMTQLTQFQSVEVLAKLPIFAGYLRASELTIQNRLTANA